MAFRGDDGHETILFPGDVLVEDECGLITGHTFDVFRSVFARADASGRLLCSQDLPLEDQHAKLTDMTELHDPDGLIRAAARAHFGDLDLLRVCSDLRPVSR
jgi:hypothetical protein